MQRLSDAPEARRRHELDDGRPTSAVEVGTLRAIGTVRTLRSGEMLFLQGERGGRLAVIEHGLIKATAADERGRAVLLGIRGPGDLVGESDAFDASARCASAVALGPATVRIIAARDVTHLVTLSPELGVRLSEALVERVRESIAHRLLAAHPVQVRLASCLLHLADRFGEPVDGVVHLRLPLTQDDLAALVDSSRDAVAKTLTHWRRLGLVETGRRRISILDPEGLAVHRC